MKPSEDEIVADENSDERQVSNFGEPSTRPFHEVRTEREDDTRRQIARWLVAGYLFLLIVNVVTPFLLLVYVKLPGTASVPANDIAEVMRAGSTVTASLVGVLGFVVGYYFKASESTATGSQRAHPQPEARSSPGVARR
jgi:hypothetical protein